MQPKVVNLVYCMEVGVRAALDRKRLVLENAKANYCLRRASVDGITKRLR
jgi:hypothetical protein